MKKLFLFAALAVVLVASAAAQDLYQLNYYSNRNNLNGLDQTTRLINPGTYGTPISDGTVAGIPLEGALCANIYVFDSTQEMLECCSCPITANGILQLSLINNLTQNPLTGLPAPNSGVIKVVSTLAHSTPAGPACGDETDIVARTPVFGLLGWQTHVQQPVLNSFVVTEDGFKGVNPFSPGSNLAGTNPEVNEQAFLGQACSFVQYLGSGKGVCTCPATS
jgi:hypothetical protein